MHSLRAFNDRRVEKRALKAANGPSLAPKGYKDSSDVISAVEGDALIHRSGNTWPTKNEYHAAAKRVDYVESQGGKMTGPPLDRKTYRKGTEIK